MDCPRLSLSSLVLASVDKTRSLVLVAPINHSMWSGPIVTSSRHFPPTITKGRASDGFIFVGRALDAYLAY